MRISPPGTPAKASAGFGAAAGGRGDSQSAEGGQLGHRAGGTAEQFAFGEGLESFAGLGALGEPGAARAQRERVPAGGLPALEGLGDGLGLGGEPLGSLVAQLSGLSQAPLAAVMRAGQPLQPGELSVGLGLLQHPGVPLGRALTSL
jgi:hypothetical protein